MPERHDAIVPDGYVRGRDGRWRYARGGDVVPGARDLTLRRLWRFRRDGDHVLVPISVFLASPELGWCRDVEEGRAIIDRRGRLPAEEALRVPFEDWDDRADDVLGIDAPELAPARLVGVTQVARLAGVEESSVRAWAARGVLPGSVLPVPPGPAWSLPVVLRALAARPGQGRPSPARRGQPPAPRRPPSRQQEMDDAMAHLDALMARRAQRPLEMRSSSSVTGNFLRSPGENPPK